MPVSALLLQVPAQRPLATPPHRVACALSTSVTRPRSGVPSIQRLSSQEAECCLCRAPWLCHKPPVRPEERKGAIPRCPCVQPHAGHQGTAEDKPGNPDGSVLQETGGMWSGSHYRKMRSAEGASLAVGSLWDAGRAEHCRGRPVRTWQETTSGQAAWPGAWVGTQTSEHHDCLGGRTLVTCWTLVWSGNRKLWVPEGAVLSQVMGYPGRRGVGATLDRGSDDRLASMPTAILPHTWCLALCFTERTGCPRGSPRMPHSVGRVASAWAALARGRGCGTWGSQGGLNEAGGSRSARTLGALLKKDDSQACAFSQLC